MLRRMPENHKGNALRLLYGETSYDPLHELPHGDLLVRLFACLPRFGTLHIITNCLFACFSNQGTKPKWPTKLGIELCRKMK